MTDVRHVQTLFDQAVALHRAGRTGDALAAYDQALEIDPAHHVALLNRGAALRTLGRLAEAVASYDRAIELAPRSAPAWSNRGNVLLDLGRSREAVDSFRQAIALQPDLLEAHSNQANALITARRHQEALAAADAAVALAPDFAAAHYYRGNALIELDRKEDAIAAYDRAIALRPEHAESHYNRGVARQKLHRLEEAVADYDRAIALNPAHAEAHYNKANCLLLLGELRQGFALYEWRWKRGKHVSRPDLHQGLWLGGDALAGKTILLHAEQGLGDTLQFCRYAPMVAALGARVLLRVPPPLIGLLRTLGPDIQVLEDDAPLPPFDVHSPLMSLPLAFGTDLKSIPSAPYLRADPAKAMLWRELLGPRRRRRIGLVWKGGRRPDEIGGAQFSALRDIDLERLAGLAAADADFFSLQKGEAAEAELADLAARSWSGPAIVDHTDRLNDLSDTAALIENLDLVIAVDTAVAHLAGALGKPVWILNRWETDWRWLLGRADSPWYPTARLFRQPSPGDWGGVIEAVRLALPV